MNRADRSAIEHFVRGTLGCQCPDEVFQSLAIQRVRTPSAWSPYTRIVVGRRLLIDVVETRNTELTADAVAALAADGRTERDVRHYNRYRLVIAAEDPAQGLTDVTASFVRAVGDDPRAHLHVVARDRLPEAVRVGAVERAPG